VAQKREVAKAITEAMVRITNTTPEATFVIFSDVAKENWAQAGELASET
jgi:4-oxalocrotonate tautomerase